MIRNAIAQAPLCDEYGVLALENNHETEEGWIAWTIYTGGSPMTLGVELTEHEAKKAILGIEKALSAASNLEHLDFDGLQMIAIGAIFTATI